MTMLAALLFSGQIAPKIHAEDRPCFDLRGQSLSLLIAQD